jgi:hypothetical protein
MQRRTDNTGPINDIRIQGESFWQGISCAKNLLKNELAAEWQGISGDGIFRPKMWFGGNAETMR